MKTVYPPQTKFVGGYNTDGQRENSIPTTNKICGGEGGGTKFGGGGIMRTFEYVCFKIASSS